MPRAMPTPCAQPGCAKLTHASRCEAHALDEGRHRRATTPTKVTRDHAERQRRTKAVAEHRATEGDWCPGFGVDPHASSDLTADHILDIQHGGSPTGPLQVLCRSCNSRKAAGDAPF